MEKALQFLDYVAAHPDAVIIFTASKMILNVHGDVSYLIKPKACSRAGRQYFLSDNSKKTEDNGGVLNTAQIIKNVMSSAAETKLGALFVNLRQAVTAWTTLKDMGHIQPPTPIQTNNTTALGSVISDLQPKIIKSTDMRYWWMRDRSDQNQLQYYWSKFKGNHANYWTKHFCAAHHREQRPSILTPSHVLDAVRAIQGLAPHKFRASSRVY